MTNLETGAHSVRKYTQRLDAAQGAVRMLREVAALLIAAMLWMHAPQTIAQQTPPPGQFAAEIAAFSVADESKMDPCAIAFVGSSSIRLWRALETDMAPFAVLNRGFGGAAIADVNRYFGDLLGRRTPRAIFFYAGENDIANGQAPADVVASFRRFLELKTNALGDTPVFFISLKPSRQRLGQIEAQREVNRAIRRLARSRSDLRFVDVASAMMRRGEPRDIFIEDGLHMNADGYAIWTRILRPFVARAARRSLCGAT